MANWSPKLDFIQGDDCTIGIRRADALKTRFIYPYTAPRHTRN